MSHLLHPGETGERLPDDESVFRLLKSLKDGKVIPEHFALSSDDKKNPLCTLSVWAESLTTPSQAIEFMNGNIQEYSYYCRLQVHQVRSLTISELPQPALDVVCDRLCIEGTSQPDTRPGAKGHAGITGLRRSLIIQEAATKPCEQGLRIWLIKI